MKFEIGDTVQTEFGIGEILFIDHGSIFPYLVGIKGYKGHSGWDCYRIKEIQEYVTDKGYNGQCSWFHEKTLELVNRKRKFNIGNIIEVDLGIGVVLFVDIVDFKPRYLVGIKDSDCGYSGKDLLTEEEVQKYVIDKGYENQCYWYAENELKLVKEKKIMNKYVKLLMKDLGVVVNERFHIIDEPYNPYHFDEEGFLIDKEGDIAGNSLCFLMNGDSKISIKLTQKEREMLESYKKIGYTTIDEILETDELAEEKL